MLVRPTHEVLGVSAKPAGGRSDYLRVENVTKTFGDFIALDGVTLAIDEGEFVCFLGPSGCGKTTLLRAISGLDPQTSGAIVQAGKDISNLPPSQRDFGIVFQSYALFPNLSVEDNIAYGLRSRGHSRARIQARVAELLEVVGLLDQARKYPAQLSGGQQQRVALARALAPSPGLLLLDEPLSALDARVRARLRGEIRWLQRRLNVTTIMVTHDQEEALSMADRIVVMNEGRIEQTGSPTEIYSEPASLFVADFIGRVNRIPGRVVGPGAVEVAGVSIGFDGGDERQRDVVVCLRPEDIELTSEPTGHNTFAALVAGLEFLGSQYVADLHVHGSALILRADLAARDVRELRLAEGSTVSIAIAPDRIRFFDSEVKSRQGENV
jgi:iron(III) transport system ATP-binding protein